MTSHHDPIVLPDRRMCWSIEKGPTAMNEKGPTRGEGKARWW